MAPRHGDGVAVYSAMDVIQRIAGEGRLSVPIQSVSEDSTQLVRGKTDLRLARS